MSMYHAMYFPLCTFTLYFPCLPFFFIDHAWKQVLLIKRFIFVERQRSVGQLNAQDAAVENEEQYT